jgi:hypothetical protein
MGVEVKIGVLVPLPVLSWLGHSSVRIQRKRILQKATRQKPVFLSACKHLRCYSPPLKFQLWSPPHPERNHRTKLELLQHVQHLPDIV